MNRIALEKATGKIIEIQGGGYVLELGSNISEKEKSDKLKTYQDSNLDTLKKNALSSGYKEKDIEVKWITDEETKVFYKQIEDENAKIPKEPTEQDKKNDDFEKRIEKLENTIKEQDIKIVAIDAGIADIKAKIK
jgi:hypothetical protein